MSGAPEPSIRYALRGKRHSEGAAMTGSWRGNRFGFPIVFLGLFFLASSGVSGNPFPQAKGDAEVTFYVA